MTNIKGKLPQFCPSCNKPLHVQRLCCEACNTAVEGKFALPLFAALNIEEQEFLLHFIKASGSLKEMAGIIGRSYPSVRNYLDDLIIKIKNLEENYSSNNTSKSSAK